MLFYIQIFKFADCTSNIANSCCDCEYQEIINDYIFGIYEEYSFVNKVRSNNVKIYFVEKQQFKYCLKVHLNEKDYDAETNILRNCDHPNIVKMFYSYKNFVELKKGFIIMEWLDVPVNFNTMEKNETKIKKLLYDIFKAIFYLHKKNIAHGDIKIENIIGQKIGDQIEYKLIDFNLSYQFNSEEELIYCNRGTFCFKAPEVMLKSIFTLKSDIYSLGAVGYILLNNYDKNMEIFSYVLLEKCDYCFNISDNAQKSCIMCKFLVKCRICTNIVEKNSRDFEEEEDSIENKCVCKRNHKGKRNWIYNRMSIHTANFDQTLLHKFIKLCLAPYKMRNNVTQLFESQITTDLFAVFMTETS